MDSLYPPESQRMDFVGHLEELRRRILVCLGIYTIVILILWSRGQQLLKIVEGPAQGVIPQFIFTTPAEVFIAYFKVILIASLVVCFPIFLYEAWMFVSPAVDLKIRRQVIGWFLFALTSFWGGIAFAYLVMLPAALKFLISFGEGLATPMISLAKYVAFFSAIILIGGLVFEIPVAIGLLTALGIVNSKQLRAMRPYSILGIFIFAAVITPTQDIVNLLLVAGPMTALYEVGIWISALMGNKKTSPDRQGP